MKPTNRPIRRIVKALVFAIPILAILVFVAVQSQESQPTGRFLSGPLVIEDQGSFFVGGVPKVTGYATAQAVADPAQALRPPSVPM